MDNNLSDKPTEITKDAMLEAFRAMEAHEKAQINGLANQMLHGLKIIPSPMLMGFDQILMVSQKAYDAIIEAVDNQQEQGPS